MRGADYIRGGIIGNFRWWDKGGIGGSVVCCVVAVTVITSMYSWCVRGGVMCIVLKRDLAVHYEGDL